MPVRIRTAPEGRQSVRTIKSLLVAIKKQARNASPKDLIILLGHQQRLERELQEVTALTLDKKIELAEKAAKRSQGEFD